MTADPYLAPETPTYLYLKRMHMTKKKLLIDVPAAFQQVSIGDKVARIGVKIDRAELRIAVADEKLCEHRLKGTIVARTNGDHRDQGSLPGLEDEIKVDGTFDVKGFTVNKESITISLAFAIADVDISSLARLAKRNGDLMVSESEEFAQQDQ